MNNLHLLHEIIPNVFMDIQDDDVGTEVVLVREETEGVLEEL